jgi:peptide/nickel transport system permease protein
MLRYAIRRLLLLIPLLVGLSILVFAIARLLPGDPIGLAAGPNASAADIERLTVEFGFDKPLPLQYLDYVSGLVQGDWGMSIYSRRPVWTDLAAYLPATLELVFFSLLLAVVLGIPAGITAAVYRNRWPDFVSRVVSLAGVSMPRFFLGLILQLAVAIWLGWLPLSGRFPLIEAPPSFVTGFLTIDGLIAGDLRAFGLAVQHLILPATAMALSPLATIMRTMRASIIETLRQDYVLTERALGLSQRLILYKYVLKNAMSATLTTIGLYIGWLLGGTVLVETIFDWPGIGLYATNAILLQDFMPIIGVTLTIGVIFVLANFVVDLLYGVFNPKVRYE